MKDKHDKVTRELPGTDLLYVHRAEPIYHESDNSFKYPEMEGDFFYHDGLEYKVDKEEGHMHQTVRAFEELMATHGLNNLLEYMSSQGQAQFWTEIDDLDGGYE